MSFDAACDFNYPNALFTQTLLTPALSKNPEGLGVW